MRKYDLPILFLIVVIYFLLTIASFKFVPKEYHPSAFGASITGLVIAILSYIPVLRQFSFSVIGVIFGWSGLIVAIIDKTCPAGFTGFLSLALLSTARTIWIAGAKKSALAALIISILLMVAAFIISLITS
jgi:hypothetical protein